METVKCNGCLRSDRKLIPILDAVKKTCFSQILAEFEQSQSPDCKLWLCWECNGHMTKFFKFRQTILQCHRDLELCGEKVIHGTSSLTIEAQPSLSYSPESDETEDVTIEILRPSRSIIKEESIKLNTSSFVDDDDKCDDFNHEDDILLIEFKKRDRQSRVHGVDKRKEKTSETGVKGKRNKKKINAKEQQIYREIELDREGIEKERREKETQDDYVNAMFKCEKCIESFPNMDDMTDHESVKHLINASKFVCDICTRSFATEVSYNYHTNRHMKRFECVSCMTRFISKGAVERHYLRLHGVGIASDHANGDILQNGDADKTEDCDKNLSQSTTKEFPCEFCPKVFKWKTSLRKHAETHRIESGLKRRPRCEPCQLSFTTTANLQKHVRTSSKHQIQLKLRKLKESGSEYQKEAIKQEIQTARAQYKCAHCGAVFQWRGNLHRHLMTHTARVRGELFCKPCNRSFSSIATYTQHMKASRRHVTENEFKYMCSECGKKFANKTRLQDHVDWEHLKRYRHTCEECGKIFKSDTSLKLHAQGVHNRDNALRLCHCCGRDFPNLSKLRTHISGAHGAQAACACADCGARYAWHSCLARHRKRAHGGSTARSVNSTQEGTRHNV